MPDNGTYIPPNNASVNAYLIVNDARAAIDWYARAFGAVVTYEPIVMDDGRIGHVEMTIGDTAIAFADEFPKMDLLGPLARGGATTSLMLHVPDADTTFALALEHGAVEERPVADQFHGSRGGTLVDPFGHRWMVSTFGGADGHAAGQGRSTAGAATTGGPATERSTQADDLWNEVGYYTIQVPEIVAARRFWGGLFGWEFAHDTDAPDGGIGTHVENSIVPLGLHARHGAASETTEGTIHPYFRIRDLDAAVARVRELGGSIETITQHASGGNATCRDDQGVPFELWQPSEGY